MACLNGIEVSGRARRSWWIGGERSERGMGVFTFVCRSSGGEWTAKQHAGDLEASASSTFDLQRRLVQAALSSDSSGGVQSSFSYVTPCSAVLQVICSILVVHYFVVCGKVGIFSFFLCSGSVLFLSILFFFPPN